MVNLSRIGIFLLLLLAAFNFACKRAEESSKVSFSLPPAQMKSKQAAGVTGQALASTDMLQRVMVNITGSGIPTPIFGAWDNTAYGGSTSNLPGAFTFMVPSGNARMIQILAVYMNSVTQNMSFYYGDTTADLLSSTIALDIPVTQLATGAIVGGQVTGRYIDTVPSSGASYETGPTGIIEISYTPPGKPPMLVEHDFIINGWFNFFMLSGASLTYTVQPGNLPLWGGPVSLDSSQFAAYSLGPVTANPSQVMRMYSPVHYEAHNYGTITSFWVREAGINVWGYWGPGLNSAVNPKYVCNNLTNGGALTSSYKMASLSASGTPNINLTLASISASAAPTNAQLLDSASTALSSISYVGGSAMSASSCGSMPVKQFQYVTQPQIEGNGKEGASGISGFLIKQATSSSGTVYYNSVTTTTNASNTLTIAGKLLPDIAGTAADTLRLFKIPGAMEIRNRPSCIELSMGMYGATTAGTTSISTSASDIFSLTSNITSTEANIGTNAALCLEKAGSILPVPSIINYHELGYDMTSTMFTATAFNMSSSSSIAATFYGTSPANILPTQPASGGINCYSLNISTVTPTLRPQSPYISKNVVISGTNLCSSASSTVYFYPSVSSCISGVANSTSMLLSSGMSGMSLAFSVSSPVSSITYSITVTDPSTSGTVLAPVSFGFTE